MSTLSDQGLTRTLARHGAIEPRHTALAVLDESCVRVSDGRRFPLPSPHDRLGIGAVLASCHRHGLGQLWVHPRAEGLLDWSRESWAGFRPLGHTEEERNPQTPRHWARVVRPGVYEETLLIRPAHDRKERLWAGAEDGRELLAALCRFRLALGLPFAWSPGHTAMDLLRQTHSGRRNTLTMPVPPPDLPPEIVARRAARVAAMEPDLQWMRHLTPAEAGRRWLHGFDKNGCYLGACASLWLAGAGAPMRLDPDVLRVLSPEKPETSLPGYWQVYEGDVRAVQPAHLPPLVPHKAYDDEGTAWITTPTLNLLLDMGFDRLQIEAAYVWPDRHQWLQPWYKRVADARKVLVGEAQLGASGAAIALAAVKTIYTYGIGYLEMGDSPRHDGREDDTWRTYDREGNRSNPYDRPDIAHTIHGAARSNLYRALLRIDPADPHQPFLVAGVDSFYLTSDEEDPARALPKPLRYGRDDLGQWKAKLARPVPLAEAREWMHTGIGPFTSWLGRYGKEGE